jgi:23S rRNA (cytosine1962-C5)-methyltransferase
LSNSESGGTERIPIAARVVLKPRRDAPVRRRHHPWVYRQAIAEATAAATDDGLVPVHSADGSVVGWGLYSPDSLIAVRMVSFTPERPPVDWLEQRVRAAIAVRDALRLDSDAVRIVNAEGDFIPGLVIDRYGDTAVISIHARGIEADAARIARMLPSMLPCANVYLKRDEHYARVEALALPSGYLLGDGDGTSIIREAGVRVRVDFQRGQKTGFYLDQRENRSIIARSSTDRRLLNLFSYTGCVALRAVAEGATRAVSVESSVKAIEAARANVELNPGLAPDRFSWVKDDVFSFLQSPGIHDVVVADPPPFARRRAELEGAVKGYLSLFSQCLRILPVAGCGSRHPLGPHGTAPARAARGCRSPDCRSAPGRGIPEGVDGPCIVG